MFDFIEKLRTKSPRVKKQIAFLFALFFSGIIFVVWLSVVYPEFNKQQKLDIVTKSEPSPIASFGGTISVGISSIVKQFSQLKSVISSVPIIKPIQETSSTTNISQ